MAEDQVGLNRDALREWAPWLKLFSAFKVALDPKKLLLAAAGIFCLALGWYVLSSLFWMTASAAPPKWADYDKAGLNEKDRLDKWVDFKSDRLKWNKLYEMAGTPDPKDGPYRKDVGDTASSPAEYEALEKDGLPPDKRGYKPYGQLRILPWFEDRGANPYLLVTGKAAYAGPMRMVSVLIEPLHKFFLPVTYLFQSGIGFVNTLYLVLVILWTLAVWAFFGGAISRMAAVQLARPNEKVSMTDALKFAYARCKSYFSAPVIPLVFLLILTVVLWICGLIQANTAFVGDILGGLLWPIVLLIGLIMAVVLVGLVGWPLMYSTISTEGSDSFDAISRSYSYVYQAPWQYLWYSVLAIIYGAVLVFFIGLMGSLTVYLGKWGVTQVPHPADREQSYLFMYAPTSFGWRDLLLQGSVNAGPVTVVRPDGAETVELGLKKEYRDTISWNNSVAAALVAFWLFLVFMLVVGFGYSYFWTATTIIYLLMRRVVDDTELDEVHLEEEEQEPYIPPSAPSPAAETKTAAPGGGVMVDSPTLRTPTPESPKVVDIPPTDGNPPTSTQGGEPKVL